MYSTQTMNEDAGRILIRVDQYRRTAEFHQQSQAESWHFVPPSNSPEILKFHRTFPTRYSWLDICPLFSFIIDWFSFGLSQPGREKVIYVQFSFFLTLLHQHWYTFTWASLSREQRGLLIQLFHQIFHISILITTIIGCLLWHLTKTFITIEYK